MIIIQREDFDIGDEIAALRHEYCDLGALVSFMGVVREETERGPLIAMTIEHYPEMTQQELERIEAEAMARWPLVAVTIIHRVGRLYPGENIVLVITASKHRAAAFEAAEFLMDYLKTHAPFWKCEETEGQSRWVEARGSDEEAAKRWKP